MIITPTRDFESALHSNGVHWVIGCDEVGRGALAGPVAVGMVVVDAEVDDMPPGLRDSKLLSEARREALAPLCRTWARFSAIGLASAQEVDALGIIACLGLAGKRALLALHEQGVPIRDATVILDGNHDYLGPALHSATPAVLTKVKADQTCAVVAAASVIAKVHRDRLMIERDALTPGYGWAGNKGYGSAAHLAAIAALGASDFHRRTWLKQATA
ncbi:MAG: ribonuclease HII [Microbacteriaceae bacterium]|nr:MAG: ribonuclease HII [Microbacteriaceae bacterium]